MVLDSSLYHGMADLSDFFSGVFLHLGGDFGFPVLGWFSLPFSFSMLWPAGLGELIGFAP
jgi:hypothetical protein